MHIRPFSLRNTRLCCALRVSNSSDALARWQYFTIKKGQSLYSTSECRLEIGQVTVLPRPPLIDVTPAMLDYVAVHHMLAHCF
jgi:hypothetical protein